MSRRQMNRKAYISGPVKKWLQYCEQRGIDYTQPPIENALDFLRAVAQECRTYTKKCNAVASAKTALSSVIELPDGKRFADHPNVKNFMQELKSKQTRSRQNNVYDEAGRLVHDGRDLCDCLDSDCPGCHFPCPKCGSERCATTCRRNRLWYYADVEIEGANIKSTFPSPYPPKH